MDLQTLNFPLLISLSVARRQPLRTKILRALRRIACTARIFRIRIIGPSPLEGASMWSVCAEFDCPGLLVVLSPQYSHIGSPSAPFDLSCARSRSPVMKQRREPFSTSCFFPSLLVLLASSPLLVPPCSRPGHRRAALTPLQSQATPVARELAPSPQVSPTLHK